MISFDSFTYLLAPAKINLFLYIINKRYDGFHNIFSLIQKISLFDIIKIKYNDYDKVVFSNKTIHHENNTVINILKLFKKRTNINKSYYIYVKKNIPTEAGLGGGSSDAGIILNFLNSMEGYPLDFNKLIRLGAEIGSDIPLFISQRNNLIIEGKGDILKETDFKLTNYFILLIKPNFSISTKTVYKKLNFELTNKNKSINRAHSKISDFVNELENVVIKDYPLIEELIKELKKNGSLLSLMSGSGSTVFGLFTDKKILYKCIEKLKRKFNKFDYYITKSLY